jgi:hypothetical protein
MADQKTTHYNGYTLSYASQHESVIIKLDGKKVKTAPNLEKAKAWVNQAPGSFSKGEKKAGTLMAKEIVHCTKCGNMIESLKPEKCEHCGGKAKVKKGSMKSKLAAAKAALDRKQADLDAIDDQIMGLDSGIPMDAPSTPEFDLLTAKREELEEEIRTMREGVQFISEWEKLKGGQWSEGIKSQLDGLDSEIANIAGSEGAVESGMDMGAPMGDPLAAPPVPEAPVAPMGDVAPEAAPAPEVAPDAAAPETPAPALEPPMASAKSAVNKKNNYQTSQKRGNIASPQMKKEGSNMANPTATKPSNLKEKLAELKTKRETIKREAQVRTAAAYTIANTMLPGAPVEKRQAFASSLLQGNDTKALVAALRQTAINAHYSKVAEQFKEVHKVELNDLLEDPSVLKSERSAVEKEIKGDAKSATSKKADDRKDAGPQTETYNDGRGCGGGTHSEPKEMEASKAGDRPDAGEKPGQTVNLSDGKSAAAKKSTCKDGEKCAGCENCKSAAKKAAEKKCDKCKGECKCASKVVAKAKKADEPPMDAPAPDAGAPPMEDEMGDAGAPLDEVPPMDGMEGEAPVDDAGAILTDEKKMVVQEEIDTVKDAVQALEQELLEENEEEIPLALEEGEPSEEELDLSSVFDQGEMEDKAASLANEGEDHTAGDDGDGNFFAPTSAAGMESVLDDSGMQVASIESYFDMQGSDADPLYSLIASETKEAASVAGFDVLESFTGEVANKMKQDTTGEARDNEGDHDEDLFVEAMKDIKPEEQGAKRTPQDARPELQAPKSAAAKTAAKAPTGSIKRVRPVVASPKAVDIATALFGSEE